MYVIAMPYPFNSKLPDILEEEKFIFKFKFKFAF